MPPVSRVGELYTDDYYFDDPKFRAWLRNEVAAHLTKYCPPPARLLDVGCGNGVFLEEAVAAGYRAEGFDASEASARRCRSKGLTAAAGDFLAQPQPGVFDCITMWDVLEHLPEPQGFLAGINRLLAPGGVLALKTPNTPAAVYPITQLGNKLRTTRGLFHIPSHVLFFSRPGLTRLVESAGFEVQRLERVGRLRTVAPSTSVLKSIYRAGTGCLRLFGMFTNWVVYARKKA